jgi:hypothetical protein
MGDDVKKTQKSYTAKAMYKEMQKRYSPSTTSTKYSYKLLEDKIRKLDTYDRGE